MAKISLAEALVENTHSGKMAHIIIISMCDNQNLCKAFCTQYHKFLYNIVKHFVTRL